ncbi:MAG: HD domain-containing protein [Candidatus Nitronauta litoralis]|uniref:HD domain-containing protein n=1 Tax=Candidatus Nitronauta litoralis TaxID=2705533 RepID=A0A7T0G1Y3_9BACT|nr:MAG: HD domain-containing protein [Candidatus Nitronauta litoralis]
MTQPAIEKARDFAKSHFAEDSSGHDWWHVHRVWNTSISLAESEGADRTIVEIAALLHDVADWKLSEDGEEAGMKKIRALLEKEMKSHEVDHVCNIVENISYKGAGVSTPMATLEGKVVQDADRLDAIGAVGIARAFAYGGNRNRLIHDPEKPPVMHEDFEAYKKNKGASINHFYEKLLLLKDRMNTNSGRKMAVERHQFMEAYLEQFFKEWNGGVR